MGNIHEIASSVFFKKDFATARSLIEGAFSAMTLFELPENTSQNESNKYLGFEKAESLIPLYRFVLDACNPHEAYALVQRRCEESHLPWGTNISLQSAADLLYYAVTIDKEPDKIADRHEGFLNAYPKLRDKTQFAATFRCLKEHTCTLMEHGRNFVPQWWAFCFDCDLFGFRGICGGCAQSCHKGHRVAYKYFSTEAYCDCPGHEVPAVAKPNVAEDSFEDSLDQAFTDEE